MLVKDLKDCLSHFADDVPIMFEDVCGNSTFDIYQVEFDESHVMLVGDEIRYEDEDYEIDE
jgi:hypothetical protein